MADEYEEEIDIEGVRALYNRNSANKGALDYFASRRYNSRTTTVDRLLNTLRQNGHDVSRADVLELFRGLEAAHCGAFVVGRHGYPSRFEWSASLISVGQAAAGEVAQVESLEEAGQEVEEEEPSTVTHHFVLRPGIRVELNLPGNFSTAEAVRFADWIRALPFAS